MVVLVDGSLGKAIGEELSFKISEFPGLRYASERKLSNWELVADGIGIHWKDLDEDLSLKGFIHSAFDKQRKENKKIKESKDYRQLQAAGIEFSYAPNRSAH